MQQQDVKQTNKKIHLSKICETLLFKLNFFFTFFKIFSNYFRYDILS